MRRWSVLLALSLVVAWPAAARAGLQETFGGANEAFWSGDFDTAARGYEELVELGVRDPDVLYNLGTCYARQGHLGRAVLEYERALRLDPGHEDALHNLGVVRRQMAHERTAGGEDANLDPPRSFWMNLLARITPAEVGIPFLICWVGLFLVLGARRLIRRELPRLVLAIVAPTLGLGAAATFALFASKAYHDAEVQEAIAIRDDRAQVREGPADRFGSAFEVAEGDRVRVLDEERGWLHVRDAEGREGWASQDDFGLLRMDRDAP